MRHSKPFIFVILINLAISLIFIDFSEAQKIGEDIQLTTPKIPEVNQLRGIEFVSPQKVNGTKPPTVTRKNGFRLPTIGEAVQILGQNIKEAARNLKDLVTPEPSSQPPLPTEQTTPQTATQAPKPVSAPQVFPEPETAAVIRTIVREPQPVSRPAPAAVSPNLFEGQLNNLKLSLNQLEKNQKSQFTDLLNIIGQVGKINSLGVAGDTGKLVIHSATLVSPAGISDTDIPDDLTVSSTKLISAGTAGATSTITGNLRITGDFSAGAILTVANNSLTINTGNLSIGSLIATSTATSTFVGPIASNATNGRFIIHGATTTGELWLNPYGGKIHLSSSSPDTVNLVSGGVGFSVSTTTFFGNSVGIGTTSPTQQLSIANRLYVGGTGTSTVENNLHVRGNLQTGAGSVLLNANTLRSLSGDFSVQSAGGATLMLNSGLVGVGSSTPWAKFSIEQDSTSPVFVISDQGTSTPHIIVVGTGRVGIGTTSPSDTFAIAGNLYVSGATTTFRNITYRWPSADGSNAQVLQTDGAGTLSWSAVGGQWVTSGSNIYYAIGNVGIGTSTPNNRLQIAATTSPNLVLSDMNGGIDLKHIYASSSAGDLALGILTDNLVTYSERLRMTNAGRVGIGTTSPNAKLAVAGDILTTSITTNSTATSSFTGPIAAASTTVNGQLIISVATTTSTLFLNPYGGAITMGTSVPPGLAYNVTPEFSVVNNSTHTFMDLDGPGGFTAGVSFSNVGTDQFAISSRGTFDAPNNRLSFISNTTEVMALYRNNAVVSIGADLNAVPSDAYSVTPQLAVQSAAHTILDINGAAANTASISFSDGGADQWFISSRGTFNTPNNRLAIYNSSAAERFTFLQEGRFGIGTTSPSDKLAVAGGTLTQTLAVTDTATSSFFGGPITVASTTANGRLIVAAATTTGELWLNPYGGRVVIASSSPYYTNDNALVGVYNDAGFVVSTTTHFNSPVGIATNSPQAMLGIENATSSTRAGVWVRVRGTGDGQIAYAASAEGAGDAADCRDASLNADCALNDIAELFPTLEKIESGDVVMFDSEKVLHLRKANLQTPSALAGVISTAPAIVFEGGRTLTMGGVYQPSKDGKAPLALAGRVPVKVNLENGEIKIGDAITASSEYGVGMKATKAGRIVGYALENFGSSQDPEVLRRQNIDASGVGKVLILVGLGYWMPLQAQTNADLTLTNADNWLAQVINAFERWLENAIVRIKELFVDKLTVGTPAKRTGITVYDLDTGEPQCLVVRGGKVENIPGGCTFTAPSESEPPTTTDVPQGTSTDVQNIEPAPAPEPTPEPSPASEPPSEPALSEPEPTPTPEPTPEEPLPPI